MKLELVSGSVFASRPANELPVRPGSDRSVESQTTHRSHQQNRHRDTWPARECSIRPRRRPGQKGSKSFKLLYDCMFDALHSPHDYTRSLRSTTVPQCGQLDLSNWKKTLINQHLTVINLFDQKDPEVIRLLEYLMSNWQSLVVRFTIGCHIRSS